MVGLDLRELLCFNRIYQKTYGGLPFSRVQQERKESALPWLESIKSVFEILSDNTFSQVKTWVIKEGHPVIDYGQTFYAITHTLRLVEYAYLLGDTTDAYLLMRRIFESVLQYLFFHVIREKTRSENLEINDENIDKMFDSYLFDKNYETDKSKMDYWATNTPLDDKQRKQRRNSITIQNYIHSLNREAPILEKCITSFFPKTISPLMIKMDEYAHGNALNSYRQEIKPHEMIENDALDLTIIILSYISLIDASLLRSNDYVGSLEFGEIPIEGSQAWIASVFSDFFDAYMDPKYPGLRKFLNNNNSAGMEISSL